MASLELCLPFKWVCFLYLNARLGTSLWPYVITTVLCFCYSNKVKQRVSNQYVDNDRQRGGGGKVLVPTFLTILVLFFIFIFKKVCNGKGHMPKFPFQNKHLTQEEENKRGHFKCIRWIWWEKLRGRWHAWN